jgi:mRNA-degrading endonuclease YafQ of YafQ-DinJ toxin-antitoxin module
MKWQLVFTEQYTRRAARYLERHPDMKGFYAKTLSLPEANPHHPSLRLRALKGSLEGLHSVSINMGFRITLEMIITDKEIILINGGDHDEVYR